MDQEKNYGEQPQPQKDEFELEPFEEVDGSPSTQPQDLSSEDDGHAQGGEPIGKFKNSKDLLDAYNNLQAEFTKKCQRLSSLEKDKAQEIEQSKFDDDFHAFLSKNPEAFAYADEIKQTVVADESLKSQKDAFETVWAKILWNKLKSPDKAKDPFVQNLILNDVELKNLIVENYVKQLQENVAPVVMAGSGERVTKPVTPKPDSFEQAKKVVLDLFSQD